MKKFYFNLLKKIFKFLEKYAHRFWRSMELYYMKYNHIWALLDKGLPLDWDNGLKDIEDIRKERRRRRKECRLAQ